VKISFTIFCLFILVHFNGFSQNFYLVKQNNSSYPEFENLLFAFDNTYHQSNISSNLISLKVDNKETKVDSLLVQNSVIADSLDLLVVVELSQAINQNDLQIIKNFLNSFTNPIPHIHYTVLLFNELPLACIDEYWNNLNNIDYLFKSPPLKRVNFLNFFNFPVTQKFLQAPNNKAIVFITKSNPKIDVTAFSKIINDNSIKFINVSLSNQLQPRLDDLVKQTNSFYLPISSLPSLESLFPICIYSSLGGKPHKIYWNSILPVGNHLIELSHINDTSQTHLGISSYDLPVLNLASNNYYFGVFDSLSIVTKTIRIFSGNKSIIITSININNPVFTIDNFKPNTIIPPNNFLDLTVSYSPNNQSFTFGQMVINTNTPNQYEINLSGGNKPKIEDTQINIQSPSNKIYTNEFEKIYWAGSFPSDTFRIDYQVQNDSLWEQITRNSTNNEYLWQVPDLPDTLIKIKVSQTASNLVSSKVIQLIGHKKKITDISWSPNDSLIVTASEDGKIILWNTKNGNLIKTLFQSQSKVISGIDWSTNGKYIAISASDTVIKIWNIVDDILLTELKAPVKVGLIHFSIDDSLLVGCLENGNICVWSLSDVNPKFIIQTGYSNIAAVDFNPVYTNLVTAHSDGKILLWDYATGKEIKEITQLPNQVLSLSFSPNGNNLAVSGTDNKIKIYDVATNENVLTLFDVNFPILAVDWLSNKRFIASSLQNLIKLWSPADGSLVNVYDQHYGLVYLIKSSHSGKWISSVDESNIVQIWSPDDFPFIRPELISQQTNYLHVLPKKFDTHNFILPTIQMGDTLYFYNDSLAINNSSFDTKLDTITLSNNLNGMQFINPPSSIVWKQVQNQPIEIEFAPKDSLYYSGQVNLQSNNKIANSNISGLIHSHFLDKKVVQIDFGTVELGNSKDSSIFVLQNISKAKIVIDSVNFISVGDSSFSLINPHFPYTMNETGGAFVPKFHFAPTKKVGYVTAFFRIFINQYTPIDIYLTGNVIAPLSVYSKTINFPYLKCENSADTLISVKNTGTSTLKLNEFKFLNDNQNEFSIISISKDTIPINDSSIIKILYTPHTIGEKYTVLSISTNRQILGDTTIAITLHSIKDSIGLKQTDNILNYKPKNDNDQIQHIASFVNTGNLIPNLIIVQHPKYFVVDSIASNYVNTQVYISFLGGLNLSSYIDSTTLEDNCGTFYKILLVASFDNNQAFIDVPQSINFGQIICESSKQINFQISNYGLDTLLIDTLYFSKPDEFSIVNSYPKFILPKSYKTFVATFNPKQDENIQDTLTIITNATNYPNGVVKIPVFAQKNSLNYNFSADTLYFATIYSGQSDTLEFQFNNLGNIPIQSNFYNQNNSFNYQYSKDIILPNSYITITSIFSGSNIPAKYTDKFTFIDSCQNEKSVILICNVIQSSDTFHISDIYPNPTMNNANIDVYTSNNFKYSYRVCDEIGRLICSSNIKEDINYILISIDLSKYSTGIYILEINSNKGKFIRKIIKY
jgi:WD40 repeat protein